MITEKDAVCELKKYDWFEIIYFLSFDGDKFETVASSKCGHDLTELANYRGSPMTTGSGFIIDCYIKTEVYNFEADRWNDATEYPYSS